jgi:hypothetical protein
VFVVLVLVVTAREEGLAARCLPPFGIARARRKHGRFSMRCSCQVRRPCRVWLSKKSFVLDKLLQTDRCRSQREDQVAEYRAINEGLGSFQEGAKKIIGGVECLWIQSRVERERSTKRLTGDCPDDHSLLEVFPVSCSPTLLPRQVARYFQILLAVSAAVTSPSLSRSTQLTKVERDMPTFIDLAVSRPPHIFELQG